MVSDCGARRRDSISLELDGDLLEVDWRLAYSCLPVCQLTGRTEWRLVIVDYGQNIHFPGAGKSRILLCKRRLSLLKSLRHLQLNLLST